LEDVLRSNKMNPYNKDEAEIIDLMLWLTKWFVVLGIGYILGRLG
jgi:hypothetical protein